MYKILDYSDTEWKDLIKRYKIDIYFAPQYCKIWEDYGDGEVQAFLYKSALGEILYPYLIRKIAYKQSREFLEGVPDGSYIYILRYSDEDGEYFSGMEHGNIFASLPHIRVNNH